MLSLSVAHGVRSTEPPDPPRFRTVSLQLVGQTKNAPELNLNHFRWLAFQARAGDWLFRSINDRYWFHNRNAVTVCFNWKAMPAGHGVDGLSVKSARSVRSGLPVSDGIFQKSE